VFAVAFGDVAKRLAGIPVGGEIRCEGFLARRYRTGITVALHITHID
jgi:primosomal replication protein N